MRPLRALVPALVATGVLVAPAYAVTPTCDGRAATIVGTEGPDRIRGTSGDDVIVALGGDDHVLALGGDDVVCGGRGSDLLDGGAGDDRLFGQRDHLRLDRGGTFLVGDVLRGGPGDDHLNGGYDDREVEEDARVDVADYSTTTSSVAVDLGAKQVSGADSGVDTLVLSPRLEVQGSPYADTMLGSEGPDRLTGMGGPDTIDGRGGDDVLEAEDANGTTPPDRDVVHGGPGDDLISSRRGVDALYGDEGDDGIDAYSPAASHVEGGPGADSVSQYVTRSSGFAGDGGAGRDSLTVYTTFSRTDPRATVTVDLHGGPSGADLSPPTTGTFTGFEDVHLADDVSWVFEGTDDADRLEVNFGGPLRARTYAGDDRVYGSLTGGDTIDGGAGFDRVDADGTCTHVEAGSCTG